MENHPFETSVTSGNYGDEMLAEEIGYLMQEARAIQENPMAFLNNRKQMLGHWLGQSLSN